MSKEYKAIISNRSFQQEQFVLSDGNEPPVVYDKTQNAVPSEATCILKAPCPNFVVSVTNYKGDPDLGDSIKVDAEKGPVEVIFDETRTFTLFPSYNLA